MKKVYKLWLVLCISLAAIQLPAQQRFLAEVFSDVNVTIGNFSQGVNIYAVNSTVLPFPVLGEAIERPLVFDFYEPAGDTLSARPLVLYFHTGNFLPIVTNGQVTGSLRDSAVVGISTRLAKMGYAVAVIDYRLGWNPLAPTQPERSFQLINAAYRGIQDARTAIRFFKKTVAENSNIYAVDTARITLWGQGTGGYISLGAASLDKFAEIAQTTDPPGKYLTDLDGNPATLETMVIPAINGDLEGKTLAGIRNPSTGAIIDTLALPNHVNYNSDFHLQVNTGGAIGDISWIEAGDVPMITFQSPGDLFAPYIDGVLKVPTTGGEVVQVQGGLSIISKANDLGNNQPFIDANIDDAYTQGALAASARAGHEYEEGLYPLIRPLNIYGRNEGSPWEWWKPAAWDTIPHPTCQALMQQFPQCNFHTISLLGNANMSAGQAKTYLDTIIGYFAPRAYAALNLSAVVSSTEEVLSDSEVRLTVAPNPGREYISLRTERAEMRDVLLYDLNGRLMRSHLNIHTYNWNINRQDLPPGLYVAKLRFDKGVITKKLMFR